MLFSFSGSSFYDLLFRVHTKLPALAVPDQIGRTEVVSMDKDSTWVYGLVSIEIDESDESKPQLEQKDLELKDENGASMATLSPLAEQYMVFTGASTFVSKKRRSLIDASPQAGRLRIAHGRSCPPTPSPGRAAAG